MKTFFKKLEYRFLVERTKIKKASFPYKTAISEANVKTNRMVTTKWAYHRKTVFYQLYFLKALRQFKNHLMNNWFNVPTAQTLIFVLFLRAGVLFDGAFSLWVSLSCSLFSQKKLHCSTGLKIVFWLLQSFSKYFQTFRCFTKFSFHHNWNDAHGIYELPQELPNDLRS